LNLLRSEEADIEVSNQDSGLMKVIFFTILSLLVLIIGSELTVTGAESIAIYFGLSEVIIGLSIVAVGTSLPELAATVAAIRQDKSLIVIGNVLGSNFLNIVVVFPIIAFGSNEVFDGVIFTRDFLIMSVFSALFILALVVGRQKDGLSRILFYGFGLIFIFQSFGVGIFSALFVVGLNLVELMVAGIQAYVFTMFSSVYIGLATEEEH